MGVELFQDNAIASSAGLLKPKEEFFGRGLKLKHDHASRRALRNCHHLCVPWEQNIVLELYLKKNMKKRNVSLVSANGQYRIQESTKEEEPYVLDLSCGNALPVKVSQSVFLVQINKPKKEVHSKKKKGLSEPSQVKKVPEFPLRHVNEECNMHVPFRRLWLDGIGPRCPEASSCSEFQEVGW